MLIGNGVRLGSMNPMRTMGGAQAHAITRPAFHQSGAANNSFTAFDPKSGYPNGYRHPASWRMPENSGGLSAYNTIDASGNIIAANLAGGLNGEAALTGVGDLTANLALVVSAVAAIVGAGIVTGEITGKLEAAADLVGSSDVVAGLGALAELVAELTAGGDISGTALGKAFMSADIVVTGELLNTANVAAAVWDAVAGSYNSVGSMGEKLNDAGSGSNPWTEVIESGYTAAEILRILAAVAAGKTTIADLGGGAATVTFRNLADTKDRVVADMTNSNRTDVVLDTI